MKAFSLAIIALFLWGTIAIVLRIDQNEQSADLKAMKQQVKDLQNRVADIDTAAHHHLSANMQDHDKLIEVENDVKLLQDMNDINLTINKSVFLNHRNAINDLQLNQQKISEDLITLAHQAY